MRVQKQVVDELTKIEISIRFAEQNIIGLDYLDKMQVVSKLLELENKVKSIKSEIDIPELIINRDMEINDLLSEKVLSIRACNVLMRSGCKTVGDIADKTEDDLRAMRNMGEKAIKEIEDFLKSHNFSLKDG